MHSHMYIGSESNQNNRTLFLELEPALDDCLINNPDVLVHYVFGSVA